MQDYNKRTLLLLGGLASIFAFIAVDATDSKEKHVQEEHETVFEISLVAKRIAETPSIQIEKFYRPPEVKESPPPDEPDISLYQEPVATLEQTATVPAGGRYLTPAFLDVEWNEVLLSVLTAEYTFGENSDRVRSLQYFIGVKVDGVYGPATYNAHNKALYPFFGTLLSGDYLPTWISGGVTLIADVERWRATSLEALSLYGQEHQIDRFLRVMQCESRGLPDAFNASSGASGLMQHLENYWPWRAKMAGFEGASPFDPVANIYTSAWLLFEHRAGGWQHWECK